MYKTPYTYTQRAEFVPETLLYVVVYVICVCVCSMCAFSQTCLEYTIIAHESQNMEKNE